MAYKPSSEALADEREFELNAVLDDLGFDAVTERGWRDCKIGKASLRAIVDRGDERTVLYCFADHRRQILAWDVGLTFAMPLAAVKATIEAAIADLGGATRGLPEFAAEQAAVRGGFDREAWIEQNPSLRGYL